MGFEILLKGLCFMLFILSYSLFYASFQTVGFNRDDIFSRSTNIEEGSVYIDGQYVIAKIDEDFICATLDWWPPEKCDYGACSWDHASLLNLDLDNKVLFNAIKAFSPLKIRLGGSLQDKVIYDTPDNQEPCVQFSKNTSEMFDFSQGCLPMHRWDQLNAFFKKSGAKIIFGLNALSGRSINSDGYAMGAWNYNNAQSLINYTVQMNYSIHGWELGNELCGFGVGTRVSAHQYALDTISLHKIVQTIYNGIEPKPLIISPGGFFDQKWFKEFLFHTGNYVDAITHHIYNLGPGVDKHLVDKILNPSYLDGEAKTFNRLESTLKSSATSAIAWVGEAGGAYNSGRNHVSNAFVYSFWYLDQLGMSAVYDTKTYCRQSLIGGNYGLLHTSTFLPNPDYYSALLWHRLMGPNVLSTKFSGTNKIRAYAHCAKQSNGVVLLLINLDKSKTIEVHVKLDNTARSYDKYKYRSRTLLKSETKRIIQLPEGHEEYTRKEYHLTAKDGNLHSQKVLLNGKILDVNSSGDIPIFEPLHVNSSHPINISPLSIVFAHLPYVLPACR